MFRCEEVKKLSRSSETGTGVARFCCSVFSVKHQRQGDAGKPMLEAGDVQGAASRNSPPTIGAVQLVVVVACRAHSY